MSGARAAKAAIPARKIYAVVRRIPEGKVATYGQVAAMAGASNPRHVGRVLRALPDGHDVPWQRVVNASGRVSERERPGPDDLQRLLLEQEGIVFDERGRIDLDRYRWKPRGRNRS
jgi:methylated-DNA-protein-cysteine methyltransferase-like protein